MMARLREAAEAEGLPLGQRTRTYNSRLAQELAKWAESRGRGGPFHAAAFRAYFADGANIARVPVLAGIAGSVGLSGEEARRVLEARSFKAAVDADWARSRAMGVTAVPTFVLGTRALVGAQPYEVLERFVAAWGVPRRAAGS